MHTSLGAGLYFFHSPCGTAYADLYIDNHQETWPIRSRSFRHWLRRNHYKSTGKPLAARELSSALDLFEAQAQFDGPERQVFLRVAALQGHIYLDLADAHWRAVEITPDGWCVLSILPVRFRRPAGLLPLPLPEAGGSVESLGPFLNLPSREQLALVVAWVLAALHGDGPYPVLAVSGEQGSAKTALSTFLRALLDPNPAPVRALPRDERDLMIAANNNHVLAFDNASDLPSWLSDAFSRIATGGSFGIRRLDTNDEEMLFRAARPIIINGIEDLIGRPDLADRAICLTLPPVEASARRPEGELKRDFELARPTILGALIEAAAHGLRNLPHVQLPSLPRMADFAIWASACETAFSPVGTFRHVMRQIARPSSKISSRPTRWLPTSGT